VKQELMINMTNRKVLVTLGWFRSTWAIARNLALNGCEVHVGGMERRNMTNSSKYIKGSLIYRDFRKYPEKFIEDIGNYLKKMEIGTYIPSHEEILVVAKYIHRLPTDVKLHIASYDKIYKLHNKKTSTMYVEKLGIPIPKTFYINSYDQLDEISNCDIKNLIIKQQDCNGAHGISLVENDKFFTEKYKEYTEEHDLQSELPIIQEIAPGNIYAVSSLAHEGEIITCFVRKNIREKYHFGGPSTKCQSVHYDKLVEYSTKILESIDYTGVAMIEFIVDEKTNNIYFLEVNVRYWGTISHDLDCGIDFPLYQFYLANDIEFEAVTDYEDGKISRWIVGDIISFFNKIGKMNFFRLVKQYFLIDDDYYMDFKKDDVLPFLWEFYTYLIRIPINNLFKKVKLRM
jgi:predicted ATP-grasp superfamily ATP-dependent carboligase